MDSRVFSYGARRPVTQTETVNEHYRLANRYRNDLCALERKRREEVAALLRRLFPVIERLEKEIAELDAKIDSIRDGIRKDNARERRKTGGAAPQAEIKKLRLGKASLYDQLKAVKLAAFGPDEVVTARKAFSKLRDEARTATRKKWINASAMAS